MTYRNDENTACHILPMNVVLRALTNARDRRGLFVQVANDAPNIIFVLDSDPRENHMAALVSTINLSTGEIA